MPLHRDGSSDPGVGASLMNIQVINNAGAKVMVGHSAKMITIWSIRLHRPKRVNSSAAWKAFRDDMHTASKPDIVRYVKVCKRDPPHKIKGRSCPSSRVRTGSRPPGALGMCRVLRSVCQVVVLGSSFILDTR